MKQMYKLLAVTGLIALGGASPTLAQVITFDEFGNGAFGSGVVMPDPGPGGLPAVMTYNLPFPGVPGDLLVHDPLDGNVLLDVIRWNGNGTLCFYSDNVGGADAPADTTSPPTAFYSNQVNANENGPEGGFQDILYTPGPNMPGFDPANPNWTYDLISDVPEPSAISLILLGLGAAGWRRMRQKAA